MVDTHDTKTTGSDIGTIQKACSLLVLALRMTGRHPCWPDIHARVAAPATVQIDPLTMSAKQMPPEHFADYSFVFN